MKIPLPTFADGPLYTTVEQINKAAEDMLLYGKGYMHFDGLTYQNVPIRQVDRITNNEITWRTLHMPRTKRQPKPKRLTKDQQIAQLQRERDDYAAALQSAKRDYEHKSTQYERACRDIEWLKDTIRQQIAAMKRGV